MQNKATLVDPHCDIVMPSDLSLRFFEHKDPVVSSDAGHEHERELTILECR
jgi:hypothetical protein